MVRERTRDDDFYVIAALTGSRRTSTLRARNSLIILRLSGPHSIRAVSSYAPSGVAASSLIQERLQHAVSAAAGSAP